jgi:hypothetical protein
MKSGLINKKITLILKLERETTKSKSIDHWSNEYDCNNSELNSSKMNPTAYQNIIHYE